METACLLHLIEMIYDCVIDPTLWPGTPDQIAASLDSPAATLNLLDAVSGAERTLVYTGISDEWQTLYRERYQGLNLFAHGMLLQPIDEPGTSDEFVTESELLGSRMYREWAAPQGFRHVMLTTLIRSQARLAFFGVTRRHDQARYDSEDKERMALLAPHVRRALTIADLIDHKSLERNDLACALDAHTTAMLILGHGSSLVHANAAGTALLETGDLMVTRAGVVEPWCRASALTLREIVETAGSGTIKMSRRGGGHAIVSALPLGCGRRKAGASGRVALFVQNNVGAPYAVEVIARVYHLTGAELRVLTGLAEGQTPRGIAARYGIAASTVRTHLRSLFAKTETSRQSELIKIMFSAPPVNIKT